MKTFFLIILINVTIFASYKASIFDANTMQAIAEAQISDANTTVRSDENGSFEISFDANTTYNIKACGYKRFSFSNEHNESKIFLEPITVKALYLTFWGASNNSKTLKNMLEIIDNTGINAVVMDVKNEYGSTSFKTNFKQANSYGAHHQRTNYDISKFMQMMKERGIYTIARIVTFKDELQAINNPEYAIKYADGTIWRNHDNMAWVDPFDQRSHEYAVRIAEEAAKVGFDEINFDYIRFPAKTGLRFSKESTEKNRIEAISSFLELAKKRLLKYGTFISVDTYGNVCWETDDVGIGQTIESLSKHADYIAPMLYPSGFAKGSFNVEHPSEHPYLVIYRSIKHNEKTIDPKRMRPWIQYFRDYAHKKRYYKKHEINEQIRAADDMNTNGWMAWSPSSKYHTDYFIE
jgi:hypothetical protein